MKALLAVAVLLLAGCGETVVNGWEFNGVYDYCKSRGGVDYYSATFMVVYCNNGNTVNINEEYD